MIKKQLVFKFFSNENFYQKVFKSLCFLFLDQEAAKDAVQEIFLRLAENAEKSNFPVDDTEAMRFVRKVALNYYFETLRKSKGQKITNNEDLKSEIGEAEVQSFRSAAHKLDILNELIVKRSHLFTERQLLLWNCIYECLSVKEIEKKIGREGQTIYSLRNKLLNKIREHITLEELVD